MNHRRLGQLWERESRKILQEKFNTNQIFKLINPEQMDWIIFHNREGVKKITLVESKSTKKSKYYPFENQKKRNQLEKYMSTKKSLEEIGFECDFYLLIKKSKEKKVFFEKIDSLNDLKRSY